MTTKLSIGQPIDKTPSGKPLRGGIRVIQINTQAIKDALWWRFERTSETPELPGNMWINSESPEAYASQITAEEKRRDKSGLVEWVQTKKDNHLLDCEVYAYAAADPELLGGIRSYQKASVIKAQQDKQAAIPVANKAAKKPNPYLEDY
jgi:phage terminase large subunit GpA-like protein